MTSEDVASLRDVAVRLALRDLSMRYARGVDRRDEGLFASVFHPDATVDFGDVYKGPAVEFVGMQKTLLAGYELTAHYLANSLYDIHADTAFGEVYFLAYHRCPQPGGAVTLVGGRYLDEYVQHDGGWKIMRRHVVWDHLSSSTASGDEQGALMALGRTGGQADDASYDFISPSFVGRAEENSRDLP